MNHIEQLYLQIIHNTCTQTSSNITISQDVSISLINLAQTQSSLPFLLPYIKDSSLLANIKYQTKLMMLNYYQIEQFTRRIADLFKRAIIIGSGLAVWDVIHACSIRGASDASIKDVEPNDLAALVNRLGVQAIFCNGATSGRLYRKYAQPLTGLEAVVLPSTSPANAAFTMPRLLDAWGTALEGYVNKP